MKKSVITIVGVVLSFITLGSFVPDDGNNENAKKPKNIIFLIGDGMGLTHLYAGMTANHGTLNIFLTTLPNHCELLWYGPIFQQPSLRQKHW